MEEKVILTSISIAELQELIAASVQKELSKLPLGQEPDELLDRKQAAAALGITLPTLREYTRLGILQGYRLGTRVRYKRRELLAGLRPLRFDPAKPIRETRRQRLRRYRNSSEQA